MRPTIGSCVTFAQDEPNAPDRVNEPRMPFDIDFLPQASDLHIDHVVERGRASWLFPDLARQHLARDEVALMPKEVFEELELAGRQIERPFAADGAPCHEVQFEV